MFGMAPGCRRVLGHLQRSVSGIRQLTIMNVADFTTED